MTEMVTIPKMKYVQLVEEIETLRKTKLYQRLLEAEANVSTGKKYTRADVGF